MSSTDLVLEVLVVAGTWGQLQFRLKVSTMETRGSPWGGGLGGLAAAAGLCVPHALSVRTFGGLWLDEGGTWASRATPEEPEPVQGSGEGALLMAPGAH